jgi:polygalacturonase
VQLLFRILAMAALWQPITACAEFQPDAPRRITADVIDATAFGVKGDGITDDTHSLQAAIDATAARHGILVLPSGVYLSGSLFLKSGMALRLDKDARLVGVQSLVGYPRLPTRVAGIEMTWPAALLNIVGQRDVKIYGEGTIDGNGKVFWDSYWSLRTAYEPKGLRWASDYDAERPRLIQIMNSSRVQLGQGLTLTRSGFWTVHIVYSHDIKVSDITIRNNVDGKGPSTDGIDIDSSRRVLIEGADIDTNDDAICLKAGRDADGLRVNRPTEKVLIRNSTIRAAAAGVTIGSETSGSVRNVEVYGLTVLGPAGNGVLFKSAHTRGGTVSDINIHNIGVRNVRTAIHVDLNWNPAYSYAIIPPGTDPIPAYWKVLTTPVTHAQGLPHFRNIHISDLTARNSKTALLIEAYPDAPVENIYLDRMDIEADTAGVIRHARGIHFSHVNLVAHDAKLLTLEDTARITGLP